MTWRDWVRGGAAAGRAASRFARASRSAADRIAAGQGARRGILAPGDRPPAGDSPVGYLDYRGTASPGELRHAQDGTFPLGARINIRGPRSGRPIGLNLAAGDHTLVVAKTTAGKTSSVIIPWISAGLRAGFTVVAVDVKGDMWDQIAEYGRTRPLPTKIRAARWDYRDPGSISWNWIHELGSDERMINAAAEALVGRERPGDPQPFFHQRDTKIMTGLLTAVSPDQASNWTATDLLSVLSDQRTLVQIAQASPNPAASVALADAQTADPADYHRVVSGATNALQPIATRLVDRVTTKDQLELHDLLNQPGLLVCGAPLGDGRLSTVASALFLRLLTQRLYERMASGHRARVLLVIDEAARVADRVAFEEVLSVSAAAGVTVVFAIQDVAQFKDTDERSTILSNCDTVIALPGGSPLTAKAISERLGERIEVERSTDRGPGGRHGTSRHATVPVLREREIMNPPFGPYCAVVHAKAIHSKPFLVDLTRADL